MARHPRHLQDGMIITKIMGILNVSRKSFFDPAIDVDDALKKAEKMQQAGADIIDIGAIATNPNINLQTDIPSEQEELDSVIPIIEKLSKNVDVIISVDTYRARVMQESVKAGARFINDQHALLEENALETAINCDVPVCLMHHFIDTFMAEERTLENVFLKIQQDLSGYVDRCLKAGMKRENIILDPGFGGGHFGKTAEENFYILDNLSRLTILAYPLLVGLSRKSMFGGKPEDRLQPSLKAAKKAVELGAAIVRVHDVEETRRYLF